MTHLSHELRALVIVLVTAAPAIAQNDECAGAIPIGVGNTPFDTTAASTSPELWACAAGGMDLWYSFTPVVSGDYFIDLCSSDFDTAVEAFSGTCGALSWIACNDDVCDLASAALLPGLAAGTTVIFRVGGYQGAFGTGTIRIYEKVDAPPVPPLTGDCLETTFDSSTTGGGYGAVYFDLTTTQAVDFASVLTNTNYLGGMKVGLEVYTTPGSYMGQEGNAGAWTLVATDDGTAVSAGQDNPTTITFAAPFSLLPGTYGIALVGNNSATGLTMIHRYTNGNGSNQTAVSGDGVLSAVLGAAANTPFNGAPFAPRVWNGRLCHAGGSGPVGVPDASCGPLPNSSGTPALTSLTGSGQAGDDISATISGGVAGQFGFFFTGPNSGLYIVPPGSTGIICIGNPQFRYDGGATTAAHLFQFDAAGNSQLIGAAGGPGPVVLETDGSFTPVPAVMAGDTRAFQAWYRDVAPFGSNFTDSIRVTFN